jgi:hypothetical protein
MQWKKSVVQEQDSETDRLAKRCHLVNVQYTDTEWGQAARHLAVYVRVKRKSCEAQRKHLDKQKGLLERSKTWPNAQSRIH